MSGVYDVDMNVQIDCRDGRYRAQLFNIRMQTNDNSKAKNYIYAEQLMNTVLGIKADPALINNANPFNKNQSKRALDSLNILADNVLLSINWVMNDADNF
jgi:hypothetical protein